MRRWKLEGSPPVFQSDLRRRPKKLFGRREIKLAARMKKKKKELEKKSEMTGCCAAEQPRRKDVSRRSRPGRCQEISQ